MEVSQSCLRAVTFLPPPIPLCELYALPSWCLGTRHYFHIQAFLHPAQLSLVTDPVLHLSYLLGRPDTGCSFFPVAQCSWKQT